MSRYCKQIGTDYFCNHPPATGYYGELLSYAFRDVGKADENCPAEATN
jgi:hypothetical protein